MAEYLSIHFSVFETVREPTHKAVLLALLEREQQQGRLKIGMSLPELVRNANVGTHSVQDAIERLISLEIIEMVEKGRNQFIKVKSWVVGHETVPIPFTLKNTDETKVAKVEQELRRIATQTEEHSALITNFKGEERDLYMEIENSRGYAIDVVESNLLAKMIQKFGVPRVKLTYRQMASRKNPIIATYAALQKGIRGQGAKTVETEPFQKVRYREYKPKE